MRILACNTGYLLGNREFLGGYLPSPREALLGDSAEEHAAMERLVSIVIEEEPDVICLIEVDRGSFRTTTTGQVRRIKAQLAAEGFDYHAQGYNKYGTGSLSGRLPFFRHLGNAVLLDDEFPTAPTYLQNGMKRLLIETKLPGDITLIVGHLSLRRRSRHRQLDEIAELIVSEYADRRVIFAGDLNTYGGEDELTEFSARTGLELHVPGRTIPDRPLDDYLLSSRSIDLFLASPELDIPEVDALGPLISDHRPVLLSVDS